MHQRVRATVERRLHVLRRERMSLEMKVCHFLFEEAPDALVSFVIETHVIRLWTHDQLTALFSKAIVQLLSIPIEWQVSAASDEEHVLWTWNRDMHLIHRQTAADAVVVMAFALAATTLIDNDSGSAAMFNAMSEIRHYA